MSFSCESGIDKGFCRDAIEKNFSVNDIEIREVKIVFEFFPDDAVDSCGNGSLVEKGFKFFHGIFIGLGIDFDIAAVQVFNGTFDTQFIRGSLCIIPEGHTLHAAFNDVVIGFHGWIIP